MHYIRHVEQKRAMLRPKRQYSRAVKVSRLMRIVRTYQEVLHARKKLKIKIDCDQCNVGQELWFIDPALRHKVKQFVEQHEACNGDIQIKYISPPKN